MYTRREEGMPRESVRTTDVERNGARVGCLPIAEKATSTNVYFPRFDGFQQARQKDS